MSCRAIYWSREAPRLRSIVGAAFVSSSTHTDMGMDMGVDMVATRRGETYIFELVAKAKKRCTHGYLVQNYGREPDKVNTAQARP